MSTTFDVIDFARRHDGVFTSQEALALGMTGKVMAKRVEDGIFVRIGKGLLALPGPSTRADLMMRAAHRVLGAVVSHESAARLHGLNPIPRVIPTMTVSHRSTHSFPGVIIHQSTDLLETHLVWLGSMRVTSPARTIVDLSKTTGSQRLECIVDNALAGQIVSIEALVDLHRSLARKGKPGTRTLRRILDDRAGRELVDASELELRLKRLLLDAGLPEPKSQFKAPWLQRINGRVDFAYVKERIVIEGDSRRWHALHDAFEIDRRRDNAAQLAGWIVLRFTWRMLSEEPWSVVQTVRGALAGRSWADG